MDRGVRFDESTEFTRMGCKNDAASETITLNENIGPYL
jgi:hypothetical protein